MKKLGPVAYRSLFFKHLERFLEHVTRPHELLLPTAVAVSGGLDSMALLWVAKNLEKKGFLGPVRALYVHHGTRSGQDQEAELVAKFCHQEGIPFTLLRLHHLSGTESNFENLARKARREALMGALLGQERLWVGHHLDDSYEWNFMQRHRSNNPKASIGIPVRNGPIIRPFLCVTRQQVKKLARFEGIPYYEDPTNTDLKFDRNYIRHQIIPSIKKRYPAYLRHYARFANFSAMMLNLSLSQRYPSKIYVYEQGAVIVGKHFQLIQLQEILHHFSNTDRGEIVGPLERMLKAIQNGKKGPFHFSGGIEVYASSQMLMIYPQKMANFDGPIADILERLTSQQLAQLPEYTLEELERAWTNLLQAPDALMNMPALVLVLESRTVQKNFNSGIYDARFPKVSHLCLERQWRFVPMLKCLEIWRSKKRRLPKKLKLLPLSNLSNLFSSQA
jgi:tRNA(Ile)-lysidine synthase